MTPLRELTTIRTGYSFRTKPGRVAFDGCLLVQMKDLDASSGSLSGELERIEAPADPARHQLLAGDVLIASRGNRNNAAVFVPVKKKAKANDQKEREDELGDEVVLAAPHLMVLQPNRQILPGYLAWVLNLPETQQKLEAKRKGSSIPFISVPALMELTIPLPSIERQKQILAIHALFVREQELLKEIHMKRKVLVDGVLGKVLRGEIR